MKLTSGFAGTRYSICLLLFFVTYGLFEIPSNLIIRRIGARYWLSSLIIAWGCCVMGMGFIHSWKVMAVLRIMLGVFEAGRECSNASTRSGARFADMVFSQCCLAPFFSSLLGIRSMKWHVVSPSFT